MRGGQWVDPTGVVLLIAWAGEAAIMIGSSLLAARSFVAAEPFCETYRRRCVEEPRVLEEHGSDSDELKRRLESGDFGYLAVLGPQSLNDDIHHFVARLIATNRLEHREPQTRITVLDSTLTHLC